VLKAFIFDMLYYTMNLMAYIYSIFSIFLLIGISNASSLENRVTSYFNGLSDSLGTSVSSLLGENGRVKVS
jgi:hypothetical protein